MLCEYNNRLSRSEPHYPLNPKCGLFVQVLHAVWTQQLYFVNLGLRVSMWREASDCPSSTALSMLCNLSLPWLLVGSHTVEKAHLKRDSEFQTTLFLQPNKTNPFHFVFHESEEIINKVAVESQDYFRGIDWAKEISSAWMLRYLELIEVFLFSWFLVFLIREVRYWT